MTGKKRIALVCDFFYPRLGGVENHIWSLASALVKLGHKVIIVTHSYNERRGVRYLPGPIKVYYCPLVPFVDEDTLPTFLVSYPLLRWIFIRENIEIVHGHQATSTLANESIVYASILGLCSVYTDHSLFGFHDMASLVLNKVLKTTLSTVNAVICVSHTCRQNFLLRTALDPAIVHVVPNAIDTSKFTPNPNNMKRIKIVVISRLVYRKGIDLLVGIIPSICQTFINVDFIIGGDGPKRLALEEMAETHQIQHRITFLGAVPHTQVRNVLIQGHIFLNCSLTESFCIALLEAASCGLYCVSTNVGGVPEVLPQHMIHLADYPDVPNMIQALTHVLIHKRYNVNPYQFHSTIKHMYSWNKVAKHTLLIYDSLIPNHMSLLQRLRRYYTIGNISGFIACLCALIIHSWATIVHCYQPTHSIDVVPEFNSFKDKHKTQ